MTTTIEAPAVYVCSHTPRAVCFLCSDQVPWWREARLRMGLSAEPPNKPWPCACTPARECMYHFEMRRARRAS